MEYVQKLNKVLQVPKEKLSDYMEMGYDHISESGELIKKAASKDAEALQERVEALTAEVEKLTAENAKLAEKLEKVKQKVKEPATEKEPAV